MTGLENEKDTKTRNKFWKGVLVGSLVTAFAALIMVGVAAGISIIGRTVIENQVQIQQAAEGAGQQDELNLSRISQKLMMLEDMVDQHFLFEEDVDVVQMEAGIYKGLLEGLQDPYTMYYTREEFESTMEEVEGVYCGIGALVSQNYETGLVTILRVFKGSPAEEAGMKKGDILYQVNGKDAASMKLDIMVSQEIRGEEGTTVDMVVIRGTEEVELHIVRRPVEVSTVEYEMMEDKIGYILVTQFELVTGRQFQEAVDALQEQGMEKMIVDLRDNPGGVLDAVVEMAAYVLPDDQYEGTILSTADKYGNGIRYYSAGGKIRFGTVGMEAEEELKEEDGEESGNPRFPKEDGHQLDIPIVVLMNGNSASASEVFAGALRDYGYATLVGTTSFGKGIVQSLVQLEDGSAVQLTTAHYYTPDGFDLHGKGLKPDVEIDYEFPEELIGRDDVYEIPLELDNQVQKAIEVLGEM